MHRTGTGPPRSSDEAAVMAVERRGRVIAVDLGQPACRDEPFVQRKSAGFSRWHEPDEAKLSKSRIRERLGVKSRAYSA